MSLYLNVYKTHVKTTLLSSDKALVSLDLEAYTESN